MTRTELSRFPDFGVLYHCPEKRRIGNRDEFYFFMTFNSLSYFLFLPAIYLAFYFTPDRWRWLLLLSASYGFYATFKAPYLLAVLFLTTAISYLCGLRMAALPSGIRRKLWYVNGVTAAVATLVLLKYLPFLGAGVNKIGTLNITISNAIIFTGVSFFTLQSLSYLTDVYLNSEEPERHFGYFALYMAFFPKLLQGPIERGRELLPQLKKPYTFDYGNTRSALLLLTCGLFKKVVVADRVTLYADVIYNNVHAYTGLPLIIGTYAFALQIYYDFASYTDMARGAGRLFGIDLMENFNKPYRATSLADFWRRWHISFSRWLRDYLFIPLQMSWRDWGQAGTAAALIITFLVSGIWHDASSGFIIWGGLHGTFLAASTYYRPHQKRIHALFGLKKGQLLTCWQTFVTFNIVALTWIFFRAGLTDGLYVLRNIFNFNGATDLCFILLPGKPNFIILLTFFTLSGIAAILPQLSVYVKIAFDGRFRWLCYYLLVMLILVYGVFLGSKQMFIYGNF